MCVCTHTFLKSKKKKTKLQIGVREMAPQLRALTDEPGLVPQILYVLQSSANFSSIKSITRHVHDTHTCKETYINQFLQLPYLRGFNYA